MPPSQPIQALPPDVIAKIKSSTSISNLNAVIVELVKNSLDANAHTIFVTVDFKRGGCLVEDDGDGIPPAEFEATGGLGKAHRMYARLSANSCLLTPVVDTSKFNLSGSFGHRGLFLASLASLSLLTLTSHHMQYESTNSIILHHSTPVARLIPAPPHQVLRSGSHGTSVTVNDLFGNMPVRVKSRALALQKSDEMEREWANLRYALVSLMLTNPQLSKLVLSDAEKSKRVSIRLGALSASDIHVSRGDNEFNLRRIGSILTQSGLISSRHVEYWHELSASVPDLAVRGAISLLPSPTRKVQFISVGKEPLLSRSRSNVLYDEVNRLFSLSDFGNVGATSDAMSVASPAASVSRQDAPSNASTRSWAKPINKWPMFFIRVDTSIALQRDNDGLERFPESDKSIQRIVDVLGAMVYEFLRQHNMRPRKTKRQTLSSDRTRSLRPTESKGFEMAQDSMCQGQSVSNTEEALSDRVKLPSFRRPQSINSGQSFTNWSRVKAAKEEQVHSAAPRTRDSHVNLETCEGGRSLATLTGPKSDRDRSFIDFTVPSGLSKPKSTEQDMTRTQDNSEYPSSDKVITWIDPHTKLAYLINARTGQTTSPRQSISLQHSRSTDSLGASSKHPKQSFWVESMLGAWENPAFNRTEMPIPSLGLDSTGPQNETTPHDCFKGIESLETAQVAKYRGKLRRRGLQTAEVIAQVDKKFILAKLHTAGEKLGGDQPLNDILLLIDQHAADERCRVEQLFGDMFVSPDTTANLDRDAQVRTVRIASLVFEVSSTEGDLFKKYKGFFSAWGILYTTELKTKSTAAVTVHTLPALIAERCRLEPHVLVDLMRREIWSSEENDKKPFRSKSTFATEELEQDSDLSDCEDTALKPDKRPLTSHSWVQQMNGCPDGIVELLNSRACRTAIMFNDHLRIEECQALVARLARCAFPFQCAHGRPSMVPILDLRSLPNTTATLPLHLDTRATSFNDDKTDLDFVEAFRSQYVT
jgi:DNA mismatch repair protein MLH3